MSAAVGVSDHAGFAWLLTVALGGVCVDRRRVDLVEPGLPVMPHHHDALRLPLPEGVALVERVRASARRCASDALAALAGPVEVIALRRLQPLPPTVEERLTDYRSQNVADWVMYREALAEAAVARGWRVSWYDPKTVLADAARALGLPTLDPLFRSTGAALGPPWTKDQKMALAAAVAARP